MKRRLTLREWLLLALLGILLLAGGYVLLFYLPQTAERDRVLADTESLRTELEAVQLRLGEKRRMEQELEDLFSGDPPPVAIAGYDNLKPILTELDPILALTTEYSLTFSTSEASDAVIRRSIAVNFTADSYQRAKTVLRKLHDSACRCMLERLSLSFTGGADDPVNVNGTIVFFEYRPPEQAPSEDADA